MENARDFQKVAFVAKEDAVVLGAKTEQGWLHATKLLYVAFASERISRERFEYL